MNKKAQSDSIALIFALIGGILAWWMAGRMDAGFIYKLVTAVLTTIVCYFIVAFIKSKE